LVADCFGAWNKKAASFFSYLGQKLSNRKFGGDAIECTSFIYQSLNVLIIKSIARSILARRDHSNEDFNYDAM